MGYVFRFWFRASSSGCLSSFGFLSLGNFESGLSVLTWRRLCGERVCLPCSSCFFSFVLSKPYFSSPAVSCSIVLLFAVCLKPVPHLPSNFVCIRHKFVCIRHLRCYGFRLSVFAFGPCLYAFESLGEPCLSSCSSFGLSAVATFFRSLVLPLLFRWFA